MFQVIKQLSDCRWVGVISYFVTLSDENEYEEGDWPPPSLLDEGEEDVDFKPEFKVPKPKKRKGRPKKGKEKFENDDDFQWKESKENLISGSTKAEPEDPDGFSKSGGRPPGRKRQVPLALKTCAECGESFLEHELALAHWKEKHPDKEMFFRCTEAECKFESKEVEEFYKHRLKHRSAGPKIKPDRMEE